MQRNKYNLSHLAHLAGHIGRLQTVSTIPVIAGDSLQLNLDGIIRLAPTRKEIVSECQVDFFAFYVPHRHVIGDFDWVQFMRTGPQDNGLNPFTGISVAASYRDPFYLGIKQCGATVNRMLLRGYNYILNRYFWVPNTNTNGEMISTTNAALTALDFYPTNETWAANMRKYGAVIARLPHILNGANLFNFQQNAANFAPSLDQDDWGVLINDDSPNVGLLDIRDLEQIKARYKTVQEANWFATFYTDILEKRFGTSGVNTDADKRPTFLGRHTQFLSGSDVNGTDDATLGSYVGKTLDRVSFNMPRRFFPEHGNVWIMCALRYPLVHTKEQHPLLATAQPDANLLLGDPELWQANPPVAFDPAKWLAGGSVFTPNVDQVAEPYGQEYRYQPNRIHPHFEIIPGYPFTQWDSANPQDWYYYRNEEYTHTFQTSQIGQWQAHMQVNCTKLSSISDPILSPFAGAR